MEGKLPLQFVALFAWILLNLIYKKQLGQRTPDKVLYQGFFEYMTKHRKAVLNEFFVVFLWCRYMVGGLNDLYSGAPGCHLLDRIRIHVANT